VENTRNCEGICPYFVENTRNFKVYTLYLFNGPYAVVIYNFQPVVASINFSMAILTNSELLFSF